MIRYTGAVILMGMLAAGSCAAPPPMQPVSTSGHLGSVVTSLTAGELWDAAAQLSFYNARSQKRNCGKGSCTGRFRAVIGQRPGPGSVSAEGTIVAEIVNRGKVKDFWPDEDMGAEARYEVLKTTGKRRYFVIARSGGPGGWRWEVREAIKNGSDPARLVGLADRSWDNCTRDTTNPNHPQGQSEFARCPHGGSGGASAMSAMITTELFPGWLDCEQGCCTAGQ